MNQSQRVALFEAAELADALVDCFECRSPDGEEGYKHEVLTDCWHCWGVWLADKLRKARRVRRRARK
jgi:hypothetical protein